MKAPLVILIGHYSEEQRGKLNDSFETVSIDSPDEVKHIAEERRREAEAIAYQCHLPFHASAMDLLPKLKIIANFGVGYDSIDVSAATERNIVVTNTPDVLNDDVADLAIGMYLSLKRRIPQADAWVRSGAWATKGSFPLNSKASSTRVGVLGLGRVGREIANRLTAFKAEIHYQSRREKDVPSTWTYHPDALSLAQSVDIVFISVVGGQDTLGIVSKEVLEALSPGGMIVNISRGTVIDEEALITMLQEGRLGGAALDVFHNEPHIDERFLTLPQVLLQPHQGSATHQIRAAMAALQRENLDSYFKGIPLPSAVN